MQRINPISTTLPFFLTGGSHFSKKNSVVDVSVISEVDENPEVTEYIEALRAAKECTKSWLDQGWVVHSKTSSLHSPWHLTDARMVAGKTKGVIAVLDQRHPDGDWTDDGFFSCHHKRGASFPLQLPDPCADGVQSLQCWTSTF